VLGVDHPLEVHDLVVLLRQPGQLRQRADGIDLHPSVTRVGQIGDEFDGFVTVEPFDEFQECVLALAPEGVVEQARPEHLLDAHQGVDAADDEGDRESRTRPLGQLFRVGPLVGHDGEGQDVGSFLGDAVEELLRCRQGFDVLAELPERDVVSGLFQDRRHMRHAVVETQLRFGRRI